MKKEYSRNKLHLPQWDLSFLSFCVLSALELEFGWMASDVAEVVKMLFVNKFKS